MSAHCVSGAILSLEVGPSEAGAVTTAVFLTGKQAEGKVTCLNVYNKLGLRSRK